MRNWPWVLLFHALFLQLAAYIVRPAAAYRALELGLEPAFLGLIAASFAIVPLFVAVLVGRATDAGREPVVLAIGAVLMVAAGMGLFLWSSSLGLLLFWNVVLGLGHLMGVIGQQSRVARGNPTKLDSAFGLYTFAGSAGQALGPLFIIAFGGDQIVPDTRALFGACTVSSVLMLILTAVLIRRTSGDGPAGPARPASLKQAIAGTGPEARRQLMGAMLVSMMVLGAVDLIAVYLPALGVERGIPAAAVGLLLTVRAVTTMASRLFLGSMVARFGRAELIVASTALSALNVGLLALPLPVPAMGAVLALAGVALGIGQPLTMTVISLASPPGTRGTWLALRLSANRFGQSAIPAGVGLVAAAAGVGGVFAATAGGLALVAAGFWRQLRRRRG
ncbi:MFS transporter [Arthrobacter sp. H5]|uniref:MFS transporter n=1 Tax=Arthrobacter sp. H5 TaxID=1267973 RepID=UPI000488AE35|nr:MFS transporter [Arthrobacter sp. H5]